MDKNCLEIEKDPSAYIQPEIIDMYPKNNSKSVPSNISALTVKFNIPMKQDICVMTRCDEVCYENARWQDDKTLIIALPKQLKKNTGYQLSLSSNTRDCIMSLSGWKLPVVDWKFKTR